MDKAETKTLHEVAEIIMGQSPDSESYNDKGEGIPFYQGKSDFGEVNPTVRMFCTSPKKIAMADDILMSVRAPIGDVNIAQEECCIGRGLAAIRPKDNTNLKYLFYLLDYYKERLVEQGTGSTFKAIGKDVLKEFEVPVWPLEKQKMIADIIDGIQELIFNRKEALSVLDNLVKSRFVEMFGDPVTNPMGWKVSSLDKHLDVVGGYAFKSSDFVQEGIPILRIGNINSGKFQETNMVYFEKDDNLSRYEIYPGDLVISLTGTVGKSDYGNVCIMGKDYPLYYLNQRNAKLALYSTLSPQYLAEVMKDETIKGKLTGINRGIRQANISNKDILNLEIPIPPLDVQKQFAKFITLIDKSKLDIHQSIETLQTLKAKLMQDYFG